MTAQLSVTPDQHRTFSFIPWIAFTTVFSALLMPLGMTTASGQVILEVQEDWELVVGVPDVNSAGPQVTCIISPSLNVNGTHAALEINQQTWPHYSPGGVQLHVWDGEYLLQSERFPSDEVLNNAGETITWTMRMAIDGQDIIFDVDNAASSTWGDFGSSGYLWVRRRSPTDNLVHYSPEVSIAHSGVGYAANRVQRLVLKEVRYYTSGGLQATDTRDRVVYEQ